MSNVISERDAFLGSKVAYEIYIRSFNDSNGDGVGDLRGITERLGKIPMKILSKMTTGNFRKRAAPAPCLHKNKHPKKQRNSPVPQGNPAIICLHNAYFLR